MADVKCFALNRKKREGYTISPCGEKTLEQNPHVRGFKVYPLAGPDEVLVEWKVKDYTLHCDEFHSALLVAATERALAVTADQADAERAPGYFDEPTITRIYKDWIGGPPAMEFLFGEGGRVYMTCVQKLSPQTPVLMRDLWAWLRFANRFRAWEGDSTPFEDPNPFWDRHDPGFLEQEHLHQKLAEAVERGEVLVQHSVTRSDTGMRRYWVTDLEGKKFENYFADFFEVLAIVAKHRLEGKWVAYAGEQFNRYRGAPWEVTGDGHGKAEGVISFYPNANPSYNEGPWTWIVELQPDGTVAVVEADEEEVRYWADYLAEAGLAK